MGIEITPAQLVEQWSFLPSKFDVNVLNFEVKMGEATKRIFRKSFGLNRFNSQGSSRWRNRVDNFDHELLDETGSLKNSITWELMKSRKGVRIYTDPNGFANSKRQGNRGSFCYAAVHNEPDGTFKNVGFGRTNNVQRQFMGHSTKITEKLSSLSAIIFEGFPK